MIRNGKSVTTAVRREKALSQA